MRRVVQDVVPDDEAVAGSVDGRRVGPGELAEVVDVAVLNHIVGLGEARVISASQADAALAGVVDQIAIEDVVGSVRDAPGAIARIAKHTADDLHVVRAARYVHQARAGGLEGDLLNRQVA